jgi:hypothetical protein
MIAGGLTFAIPPQADTEERDCEERDFCLLGAVDRQGDNSTPSIVFSMPYSCAFR